jgi:NTF2 fold immunity protein
VIRTHNFLQMGLPKCSAHLSRFCGRFSVFCEAGMFVRVSLVPGLHLSGNGVNREMATRTRGRLPVWTPPQFFWCLRDIISLCFPHPANFREKMQMNRILFLISVLSVASFHPWVIATRSASSAQESKRTSISGKGNLYSTPWGKSYRPKVGVVPDEKTAASIAEAILIPIYGDKQIQSQKPFKVTLENNIWLIEGALADPPEPRGSFALRLSKVDGRVLFITHSQ